MVLHFPFIHSSIYSFMYWILIPPPSSSSEDVYKMSQEGPSCGFFFFFRLAKWGSHVIFFLFSPPFSSSPTHRPFHLPTYFLHLAGLNHQTHTHLFLLRALHPLPAVPYSYFTLSVTLSHLFSPASGEHEPWKNNRQVMGEVCVCNMWGLAHLHECTYAQMTKAAARLCQKKKKKIPSESIFGRAFGSVPTLNWHPQNHWHSSH